MEMACRIIILTLAWLLSLIIVWLIERNEEEPTILPYMKYVWPILIISDCLSYFTEVSRYVYIVALSVLLIFILWLHSRQEHRQKQKEWRKMMSKKGEKRHGGHVEA